MSKDLVQVFNFNDVAAIRTIEKNGEVFFVAADIAAALDFDKTANMLRMLDEDEKGVHLVSTLGGVQQMAIITEPGLYSVLNKSNKETVKPFQRWVNHEVLPAIRKTGHYAGRKAQRPEIDATTNFKAYFQIGKLIGLDKNSAALAANNAAKQLTGTDVLALMGKIHLIAEVQEVALTPTEIAAQIGGTSPQKVNKLLEEKGFQRRVGDKWETTDQGKPFGRLFDTNKKHSSGVPVTQIKWLSSIISEISQ